MQVELLVHDMGMGMWDGTPESMSVTALMEICRYILKRLFCWMTRQPNLHNKTTWINLCIIQQTNIVVHAVTYVKNTDAWIKSGVIIV